MHDISRQNIKKNIQLALIFPNLFAIEEARIIDIAAMILVTKNKDPNFPSPRLNLSLKNHVTQELMNC
jgi:hypothetical protein